MTKGLQQFLKHLKKEGKLLNNDYTKHIYVNELSRFSIKKVAIDLSCFTDLESKDFEYGHIATKTLLKKEPCEQYDSGLILTKSWSYKTWVYELTFIDGWQSDNTISFYFE